MLVRALAMLFINLMLQIHASSLSMLDDTYDALQGHVSRTRKLQNH